ncbi:MAG TPA: RsmG family class I SAM-dependent methyltransferase, partial [Steroidobacteraceae bacterium]|nr:RsmG family class I SAM-dependent methyltransferase [Steroidobacteraceae bacterium]
QRLERYLSFLTKWNNKINLTAFSLVEPSDEALDRLLVEPVIAAAHIPDASRRMIDIGSGSGSPAIPLLLAAPRLGGTMVESKTRKGVFLLEALRHLEVSNWTVETARFEQLLTRADLHEVFDGLTIRAVRMEKPVLLTLQAFVRPGGALYLFQATQRRLALDHSSFPLLEDRTVPLVESLSSSLTILRKDVPRGTRSAEAS